MGHIGTVPWNPSSHPPDSRDALHARLDALMQAGELPWSGQRDKLLRFTAGTVEVVGRGGGKGETSSQPPLRESHRLDHIFNLV